MKLDGTTTLLTGATGGLGHAIARALAARGSSLVLTGRRTDVLEPLAAETRGRAIACDLSDPAELDRLLAEAGDVDLLVANAALPGSGHLHTFSIEEIDRVLAVNLRAPIVLAHALSSRMVARGSGHLAFVSSLAGKAATPGTSIYSATKFGLRGFAQGLRADLHSSGIGVSAIFPGFISDAGMLVDAEVDLPRYVGTRTSEQVATALVRAIERNKAEVDVAPLSMRAGTTLAALVPELAARVQRRLGSTELAEQFAEGQRPKR